MLRVSKLSKRFGGIRAVDGCSFDVKENSITALIGPNGAGKTTVFNLLSGFELPDTGEIVFDGSSIVGLAPHVIARRGLARTFQLNRLFPELTVVENLIISRSADSLRRTLFGWRGVRVHQSALRKEALAVLKRLGMEKLAARRAGALSYGQRKIVEIGRALNMNAKLILLDEPAAGVNPRMREDILAVLKTLKQDGTTVLFIEHDMKFVMEVADHVVVLDHGQEIADGPPKKVRNDPKVLEAYLGSKVKL